MRLKAQYAVGQICAEFGTSKQHQTVAAVHSHMVNIRDDPSHLSAKGDSILLRIFSGILCQADLGIGHRVVQPQDLPARAVDLVNASVRVQDQDSDLRKAQTVLQQLLYALTAVRVSKRSCLACDQGGELCKENCIQVPVPEKLFFLLFLVAHAADHADHFLVHQDRRPDLSQVITVVLTGTFGTESIHNRVCHNGDLFRLDGMAHDIPEIYHAPGPLFHASAPGNPHLAVIKDRYIDAHDPAQDFYVLLRCISHPIQN